MQYKLNGRRTTVRIVRQTQIGDAKEPTRAAAQGNVMSSVFVVSSVFDE
jgi:hypothetical protein